jgi:CBS domain-containing protein
MLVKDIMTRATKSIRPDTRLQEAAALMCLNRFTTLPITDENDKLIGILAERDVLSYLFPKVGEFMHSGAAKVDFESYELDYKKVLPLKAIDLMTKNVISVSSETPLLKAVATMAKGNLRRIPVVDDGKLVGIVSLGDIHRAIFLKSFASG